MKKWIALTLCLLLCFAARAEAPDASSGGTLTLNALGEALTLDFDDDPEYSRAADGFIQASFYVETPDGALYEAYLIFPEDVASGDEISTQSCILDEDADSGIILSVSDDARDIYACAGQAGIPDPEGSRYAMRFETVTRDETSCSFSGTLEATLIALDDDDVPLYPVEDVTGRFDFTFPLSASTPVLPYIVPLPSATPDPWRPGMTPPPGAQKV